MTAETRTTTIEKEISVYICDRCGKDIGPAPIKNHGGYSINGGVTRPDKGEYQAFTAELCEKCFGDLCTWLEHKNWRDWELGRGWRR